jgi:hypothetical protein
MFENAVTYTKQGDIGEARAIYEYTRLGYGVSRTVFDSMKYDLIIDIDGQLYRVQVKTTSYKSNYGVYQVALSTSGGNQSFNKSRPRQDSDYDILFVMADNGDCWSVPVSEFEARNTLNMGSRFDKFLM